MIRISAILMVVAFLAGCEPSAGQGILFGPANSLLPPPPVVQLIGRAEAHVLAHDDALTSGLGADALAGDLLMENAFVRFVVAGPDRVALGGPGGNVVDAVLTGQSDRLRLLAPLVASERGASQPVYESVVVTSPGGADKAAVVTARGRVCGPVPVALTTTYSLQPDSDSLEIVTRVTNNSSLPLRELSVLDRFCHGRSFRFSPSIGLALRGHGGEGAFVAVFDDVCSWGLVCRPTEGYKSSTFNPGESILDYGPSDIQPGASRVCRRKLVVVHGGPDEIWRRVYMPADAVPSRLRFKVVEKGGGATPAHFELGMLSDVSSAAILAIGGRPGVLDVNVVPGLYQIAAQSPGFSNWGPVSIRAEEGKTHVLPLRFAPPAGLKLDLKADVAGVVGPTQARIVDYPIGVSGASDPPASAFPVWPPRGVKLTGALQELVIPLAPGDLDTPGDHIVAASRGPLFDVQRARIRPHAGEEVALSALLRRVVDPGDYVSVDFRQYDDASPDCPLTLGERLASNRCEGVDVGFVARPFGGDRGPLSRYPGDEVVNAVRLEVPGGGLFTVWGAEPDDSAYAAMCESLGTCVSPSEVIGAARGAWPDARIAAHLPFEPGQGVFALQGWTDPRRDPPAGLKVDFDALEILTGRDVERAKVMLDVWFRLLNRGHVLMAVGASGSRGIFGDEAGVARTFVRTGRDGATSARSVAKSLRGRNGVPVSFVSNGPFLEAWLDGLPAGSLAARKPGDAHFRVRMRAAPWVKVDSVAVYRNGRLLQRFEVTDRDRPLDEVAEVSTLEDCWFVAVAEGRKPMIAAYGEKAPSPFAVTNPIWIDADGDGRIRVIDR